MTTDKRAAIAADVRDTTIDRLSAEDFLAALKKEAVLPFVHHWPEKKKYELFVEPERSPTVPQLADFLRKEKKKLELEPWKVIDIKILRGLEVPFEPRPFPGPNPLVLAGLVASLQDAVGQLSVAVDKLRG